MELRRPIIATTDQKNEASGITIVTVCSGNICRSPFAESLLRSRLAESGVEFTIRSAGTIARPGDSATPEMQQLALQNGIDLDRHRATYLTESTVKPADLVLTMTRGHRRNVVEMMPRKVPVTFTLREFARLSDSLTDDDILAAVADTPEGDGRARVLAAIGLVRSKRGQTLAAAQPEDDDVVDPYRSDQRTYELSGQQLVTAIDSVSRLFDVATRTVSRGYHQR